MSTDQLSDKDVFNVARRLDSQEVISDYLDQICGDDLPRRARILKLLKADKAGSFLEKCPEPMQETVDSPVSFARVGQSIGPFKLREQIGEGGMGVVYVAEQQIPIRRKVALKVIKPGMDTKSVIARFESERQALAVMNHPSIAKVLDAGTTDMGRPYFVMELVQGIAITDYCDQHRLSIRERLMLFESVCHAIQHAHQKGIIHRDIKPSNVLVTEQDGKPIPKVIDFGVAKAIGQSLTDRTIYTSFQAVIGTPLYMSPEQAALSNVDVDTRSDVYSLGVLLYELLTGTTPFDKETLQNAAQDEVLRIIREREPVKPSTKINTLGDKAVTVSEGRKTNVAGLGRAVRGDLDWIVMKALDKDRGRRYSTASGLAADVSCFLENAAVEARPPSTWYRLQKTYARNRGFFVSAILILGVLVAGLTVSLYFVHRASKLNDELSSLNDTLSDKNRTLQRAFIDRAIQDAMGGNFRRAELSIAQAEEAGADADLLSAIRGLAAFFAGDVEESIAQLREATTRNPESIEAWSVLFLATLDAGQYEYMGECRQHLLTLTPQTETERMLKAITNVYATPKEALAEFDALAELQQNSAVLRGLRAIALNEAGKARKEEATLLESLQEFEWSSRLMPDNRFLQSNYLKAIANTLQWVNHEPETSTQSPEDIAKLKARAEELIAFLESNNDAERFSRITRATYFKAIGDIVSYNRVVKQATPGVTARVQKQAAELFANHDYDELEAFLKKHDRFSAGTFAAFMEMDSASPERRLELAQNSFNRAYGSFEYAFGNQVLDLEVFLVAGDIESLVRNAKRLQQLPASFEWYQYDETLRLYTNPTKPKLREYLEQAEPFSEESSYANWVAGLLYLAWGERDEAREHFLRATEAGKFDWWSHVWAEAFLTRMEKEPRWPDWIPESVE